LVILASEDIGNASVYALPLAVSGMTAMEKIGMPEARIILAHITTYLASCPKSNSAYSAIQNAEKFISDNGTNISIPMHLRNPATFLDKKEGAGENYKYPHDYPGSFILESYFPAGIASSSPQFYFPKENGMEKTLKDRLSFLWDGFGKKKYK
ncbi:MAG: replication-associated recombination protein A, partial [Leptospira sp.]|nr:replication-associated recombination protein A [Leptospira sp.]